MLCFERFVPNPLYAMILWKIRIDFPQMLWYNITVCKYVPRRYSAKTPKSELYIKGDDDLWKKIFF